MTSSRLPGKVLAPLQGKPMLAQELARLQRCETLDAIVVATTANASDDPIAELAARSQVGVFRGDENDVLGRYAQAARAFDADVIVRLTADCPLIDAGVVDATVRALLESAADYASNTRTRSYPRGLDTEVFHRDVLERMARLASSPAAREHVTYFLHRERPELFVCRDVVDATHNNDLRWTVDTEADLALVRAIYEAAGLPDSAVPYAGLVRLVRTRRELVEMNAHVRQATE